MSCRAAMVTIVCLLVASCQRLGSGGDPEIELKWILTPDPPRTGDAMLSFTLIDSTARRPVMGAEVRLEGNMSHPGMRPIFSSVREIAPGRYEAPLDFTMAGDWIILIDAKLTDGRTIHRQVEIRGVRPR